MTATPLRLLTLLALTLSAATVAHAEIPNYSFGGIEGVGTLDGELDDRLGITVNADEHIINIEDCDAYLGGQFEVTLRIEPRPASYRYAVAYAPPGKTCSTTDTNPSATDGCVVVHAQRELDATSIRATVDFDKLMGTTDCTAATEGDATLYYIIQNTSTSDVDFETILFDIDLKAPAAPTLDTLTSGDGRFVAKWTDSNTEDDIEYVVYYAETAFSEDDLANVDSSDGITTTSYAVESGLSNEATYFVSVAARDNADNESAISNQLEVMPASTTDFWEAYQGAGGADNGGFCFIATAAYGTPLEGELGTLRRFRDEMLMGSDAGRSFVHAYYQLGRFGASYIADKPALRAVVRVALVPLVWLAELTLALGPFGAFGALLAVFAAYRWLRRKALTHPLLVQELR